MDYIIQTPLQLTSHLRALRRARGLSQAALGAALNVGQTRVARIENHPTSISVQQLIDVLSALGVQLVLRAPDSSTAESAGTPPTDTPSKRGTGKREAPERRPVKPAPAKQQAAEREPLKREPPKRGTTKPEPVDGDW